MRATRVYYIGYIIITCSFGLVESRPLSSIPPIIGLFCGDSAASDLIASPSCGIGKQTASVYQLEPTNGEKTKAPEVATERSMFRH